MRKAQRTSTGEREEKDGRTLIPNTWYIDVCYYERFPLNSPSTFKFAEKMYTENAEGVIARNIAVQRVQARRSARLNAGQRPLCPRVITLGDDEIERLNDMPALDSLYRWPEWSFVWYLRLFTFFCVGAHFLCKSICIS